MRVSSAAAAKGRGRSRGRPPRPRDRACGEVGRGGVQHARARGACAGRRVEPLDASARGRASASSIRRARTRSKRGSSFDGSSTQAIARAAQPVAQRRPGARPRNGPRPGTPSPARAAPSPPARPRPSRARGAAAPSRPGRRAVWPVGRPSTPCSRAQSADQPPPRLPRARPGGCRARPSRPSAASRAGGRGRAGRAATPRASPAELGPQAVVDRRDAEAPAARPRPSRRRGAAAPCCRRRPRRRGRCGAAAPAEIEVAARAAAKRRLRASSGSRASAARALRLGDQRRGREADRDLAQRHAGVAAPARAGRGSRPSRSSASGATRAVRARPRSCRGRPARRPGPRPARRSASPRRNAPRAVRGLPGIGRDEGREERRRRRKSPASSAASAALEVGLLADGQLGLAGLRRGAARAARRGAVGVVRRPRAAGVSPSTPTSQPSSSSQTRNSRSPSRFVPSVTMRLMRNSSSSVLEVRRWSSASMALSRSSGVFAADRRPRAARWRVSSRRARSISLGERGDLAADVGQRRGSACAPGEGRRSAARSRGASAAASADAPAIEITVTARRFCA